ncbi:MAG: hypothetical protein ACT4NL_18600 [Pseudomarimonas sp.]
MIRAFAVLAAMLMTSVASARQAPQVDLSLRDLDSGAVLPVYWSDGRAHVPGTPGHRYAVVLENRSAERVLAVLSVDGVNAVTGETANPAQSGYVLGPWQRTEVRGWRKDLSSIAEFVFTDLGDSYAARTHRPGNVGVIGVAVFNERQIVPRYDPPQYFDEDGYPRGNYPGGDYKRDARPAAPSAAPSAPAREGELASKSAAPRARQELGTGHGTRRYDPISRTEFVRASSQPSQVTSLYYDDTEALVARGIIHRHRHPARQTPQAFPTSFVPDPPRWR